MYIKRFGDGAALLLARAVLALDRRAMLIECGAAAIHNHGKSSVTAKLVYSQVTSSMLLSRCGIATILGLGSNVT